MYATANKTKMKACNLFLKRPLSLTILSLKLSHALTVLSFHVNGLLSSIALGSIPASISIARKCSTVRVGGACLLNFAILWRTSIASCSLPLDRRNFGDSWKLKTKYRRKKMSRVIPPRMISKYRHPMLD